MNKERLEYLVNEMYYNYLEQNEAQELIDYIEDLQQRISRAIEYIKNENLRIVDISKEIPELCEKELLEILGGKE